MQARLYWIFLFFPLLSPGLAVSQGPVGDEFRVTTTVNNDQEDPQIGTSSNGDFVIVWESSLQDGDQRGIFGQKFGSNGLVLGAEFQANSWTTGSQSDVAMAMAPGGTFVVIWEGTDQDGDADGVFGQVFSSDGNAVGQEFQANSWTTNDQDDVAVAMWDNGDFVVSWESTDQDGFGDGVFAQRFTSSGLRQGTEFQVNSLTTGGQRDVAVAAASSGEFVFAWEAPDADARGIVFRRFDSNGNGLGSEAPVNTTMTNFQEDPAIAVAQNGSFVIAWESTLQDGDSDSIVAQRFSSAGLMLGTEFLVNSWTTNDQDDAAIGISPNGDFVITWESDQQDGFSSGTFAQRYASDGTIVGAEFQVNTTAISYQGNPEVQVLSNSDFVVTWESSSAPPLGLEVYARLYDGDGDGSFGFPSPTTPTSTPSVTPPPTETQTPGLTPTETPTSMVSPTPTLSPTSMATASPTSTPENPTTATPTATPGGTAVPVQENPVSSLALLVLGFLACCSTRYRGGKHQA